MRTLANRKSWLVGLGACLAAAFAIVALLPHWSWAVFDEVGWLSYFDQGWTTASFARWDYETYGRIRPLSAFWVFSRFSVFGVDPHVLRVERLVEFVGLLGAAYWWLRTRAKVALVFAAFAVAFAVKAPPLLELIRYLTLSELHGTALVLAALFLRRRSRVASYACLAAAALTKEPFAIFGALPALLERRRLESAGALVASAAYLAFLYFCRRGGYYELGMSTSTLHEILTKTALDFSVLLPVLFFARKELAKFSWRKQLASGGPIWQAAVFTAFGLAYASVLTGKASGYTYHFVPSVLLFAMALALVFQEVDRARPLARAALLTIGVLALILPARLVWNVGRLYTLQGPRWELTRAVRESGVKGTLALNCYIDMASVGYAADRRDEDHTCYRDDETAAHCCTRAGLYALLADCPNFDSHRASAVKAGLRLLGGGKDWALFACRPASGIFRP